MEKEIKEAKAKPSGGAEDVRIMYTWFKYIYAISIGNSMISTAIRKNMHEWVFGRLHAGVPKGLGLAQCF